MSWLARGFEVFAAEPATRGWCDAARGPALAAAGDAAMRARWLRHGGTWFVGVDVLDNDSAGRVGQGPPLAGEALAAAEAVTGRLPLHPAQVSVTYPGYPGRDAGESDSAHRYRRTRDAAHLDGLLPEGPARRRHLREPHGFILGLALTEAAPGAAPLVVWEGSHEVMRAAFRAAFDGVAPEAWGDVDLTETYQQARRRCFETCARVEIALAPGEAVLVHRLALHGVAPWAEGAGAAPEGRAIAYLRPCLKATGDWLDLP
ncbi:hypothetical protein [Roseicyclus amphidinii]|uniref:hypothetical protein n=1 Tax=Roseicyclus amphidinii TaxID=3034232 RepID=UPI0024E05873|nr:hypothetical protein [Roseicyclus sp. Amp-Y-6]